MFEMGSLYFFGFICIIFSLLMAGVAFMVIYVSRQYMQKLVSQKLLGQLMDYKKTIARLDRLEADYAKLGRDHQRLLRHMELVAQQVDFQKGAVEYQNLNPKLYN